MKITLNKDYGLDFMYYLKSYIIRLYNSEVNRARLKLIDEEFEIDSHKILLMALNTIRVSAVGDCYVMYLDRSLGITPIIDAITYGNSSVKGYPILIKLFDEIKDNLYYIYEQ